MPFWSVDFGAEGSTPLKDPKRSFRFTVQFTGIQDPNGNSSTLWYAKSVQKPSFSISTAEHKYLNHTFQYPGSVTWNECAITLVDPVTPDLTATLSDIVVQSGYSPPTNAVDADQMGTMSKAKAAGALGTVYITQIDSDGKPLETWTLWNAFITDVKYGDLSYGEDELTELSVTLKYDWARVQTANNSAAIAGGGNEFFGV
jgi:hypothetical protein